MGFRRPSFARCRAGQVDAAQRPQDEEGRR